MMTIGQNPILSELNRIQAELRWYEERLKDVQETINFAERFGFQHSIDTMHKPTKARLEAEYAALVQKEREVKNSYGC